MVQLLGFIPVFLRIADPIIELRLIDAAVEQNTEEFKKYISQYIFYKIIHMITQPLNSYFTTGLYQDLRNQLQRDLFQVVLKSDIEFFEKYNTEEIQYFVINGIHTIIQNINLGKYVDPFRNFMYNISTLITLYTINPYITFYILLFTPFHILYQYKVDNYYKKQRENNIKKQKTQVYSIYEIIKNIQTVKSIGNEEQEIQALNKHKDEQHMQTKKNLYVQNLSTVFDSSMNVLRTLLLFYCSLHNMFDNSTSVEQKDGELTSKNVRLGALTTFLKMSSGVYSIYYSVKDIISVLLQKENKQQSRYEIEQFYEMLLYKSKVQFLGQEELEENEADIEFKNISFNYPTVPNVQVLDNLSLKIQKGSYVAIVGKSGAGKSTIIKILQRFYDVNSGALCIGNHNIKDLTKRSLQKRVGYVSQDTQLFNTTIEKNIAYGVDNYTQEELIEAVKMAGCMEFVENKNRFPLGLETIVGEKGQRLSGGQIQRLSIARALIRKPNLLIFDEATSNLDAEREHEVQENIENLSKNANKQITIIVISHRLSTVVNCQNIFVLKDGKIDDQGTHQQLLRNKGHYSELFSKQINLKIEEMKKITLQEDESPSIKQDYDTNVNCSNLNK